jgi:hypothetical protein
MKFPAEPGVMLVHWGAPSVPPADTSLNCQVRVGVAPEKANLQASTPNVFMLGTVASDGISKLRLNETAPPATGTAEERIT